MSSPLSHASLGVALLEGKLHKHSPKKARVKRWQRRHFVLTPSALTYYKKKGDATPLGVVDVAHIIRVDVQGGSRATTSAADSPSSSSKSDAGKRKVFDVETSSGRVYVLAADTDDNARRWVETLHLVLQAPKISTPSAPLSWTQNEAPDLPVEEARAVPIVAFRGLEHGLSGLKKSPTAAGSSTATKREEEEGVSLLPGERVLTKQDSVFISQHHRSDGRWGHFWMTTYRFIFFSKNAQDESVPLSLLTKVESAKHEERDLSGFLLSCKDFRVISLFFLHPESLGTINSLFKHLLFPPKIGDLYAFQSEEKFPLRSELQGWPLYRIDKEFARQQLSGDHWRVTTYNKSYSLPHFPNSFIVPASLSDDMIGKLGEGVNKWQRWVLALCWQNSKSVARGCLLRTSEFTLTSDPSVSLASSPFDGKRTESKRLESKRGNHQPIAEQRSMLGEVLLLHPRAEALHVFNTSLVRKKFTYLAPTEAAPGAVETIKVEAGLIVTHNTGLLAPALVSRSLLKLSSLIQSFDPNSFTRGQQKKPGAGDKKREDEVPLHRLKESWEEALDSTHWLESIRQLLNTTSEVVNLMQRGEPVVIQSSDGDGAVPQVTSLVQVCLDPYFRTVVGFCFLIEKEWMAYVHKWGQQHKNKYQPKQHSHMFTQFIDAVWQLWSQTPQAFEFDNVLLLFLLESVYSARFGSFLADCQKDRIKGKLLLSSSTVSVWSYIHENEELFRSDLYQPNLSIPLQPQPNDVKLWTEYYMRWACYSSTEQAVKAIRLETSKADHDDVSDVELNLSNHLLYTVPPSILPVPRLTALDLSQNFISTLAFSISPLSSLRSLDLSHNLLTCLPTHLVASLPQLVHLASLSLAHNRLWDLSALPSHQLRALTHLDLSHNRLSAMPAHLSCLTRLQVLSLAGNAFTGGNGKEGVPEVLHLVPSLVSLDLAHNAISSLSARFFASLTGLESLNLSSCSLVKIEPGLSHLAKLRVLHLSNNPQLCELPGDLWQLSSLEEFHARNCLGFARPTKSADAPTSPPTGLHGSVLLRKKRLGTVRIGIPAAETPDTANTAAALPVEFGFLGQLRTLDIANNAIASIPAGCFVKWSRLERLLVNDNRLTALSADVGSLSALKELDLRNNRLRALTAEIANLKQLTKLNLEGNWIAELPAQLSTMQLHSLEVGPQHGCIRSPPPEIVAMGSSSVISYLSQLLRGQQLCFRMKLMFVGQENVGKTSLLRALQRREKKIRSLVRSPSAKLVRQIAVLDDDNTNAVPLSTDGIEINPWNLAMPWGNDAPMMELSAWDFAGQEIYYSTHQFFLSERSLYVVVFNLLAPEQSHVEYWLRSVRTAGGNSPILLIGTHAEDERCTDDYLNIMQQRHIPLIPAFHGKFLDWLTKKYCARFPNILGIHFVSSLNGKGMDALLGSLQSIIANQEHMGQPVPSNYLELEKLLVAQGKERMPPIMSWDEFRSLARLCLIEREHDLLAATSLLHNFGSLVHFPNDEKLKDVVILEPQWLMNVMSTVVSTKHNYCKNGVMPHSALPHIWRVPTYPPQVHPFILSLLERFELSFPVGAHIHKLGDYAALLRSGGEAGSNAPAPSLEEPLYLIPSLLPEVRPLKLSSLWPLYCREGESIFGRCYRFEFVPKGFMGRLIIRLLAFPLAAQLYWRHGILAHIGRERILLELFPDELQLKITVRTELKGEQMSNLSWLIFAAVDSLVKEWYNLNAKVLVPCSHCMVLSGQKSPFMFPLEKCQQAATSPNQSILFCPINGNTGQGEPKPVRLDHIAPDLAMVHLDRHKIKWSDLEKEETQVIGVGGFASVYKGKYLGEPVAIKELRSAELDPTFSDQGGVNRSDESRRLTYEEFRHEVWIMSGLAHPNLVGLRGFCLEPPCIVTELVEAGSLFDFLSDPAKSVALDWPLRLKIAKDIAKACAFLHSTSPPVMHRDLKSPNILLADLSPSAAVVAKVCDFGVSLSTAERTAMRKVDCPVWLAPEILENKAYTEKADVYSLGVIFWELLTKERFFGHVKFMSILEDMVKEGQRPAIPDSCIPSYKQLIERCWAQVPEERPSCKEIVERINAIIQGVCPDIATYDADADATFKAKLEREAELRLQHDKQLRQKRQQKVRAAQRVNVNVRAVGAAEPKTRVLTQSIKELAASRCSKGDIIEFMEEFLKLRKESLRRQVDDDPDEPDDDGGDAGVAAGAKSGGGDAVQRAKKAEEERRWIDEFLSRLESEKAAPPKRDVVTPPPDDDDDAADSDSDSDGEPDSMASPPPKAPGSAYQESPPLSPLAVRPKASSRRGLMVSGVLRDRDGIPAPLSPQPRKAGSYRGPAPPRSPSLDDFKSPSLSNSGGDWRSTSARTGQRADGLGSTRSLSGLTPPSSDADKSDRTLTDAPPETPHASAAATEAAPALTPGKTDDDPAAVRRPTVSGWSMGTRSAPTPRRDDVPRSALVTGQTLAASAPEPSAAAPTTMTSSWSKSTSWNAARGRTNTLSTRGPTQPDTP